jgi:hypothetical protein
VAVRLGIVLLAAGTAGGETWKGRDLRFTIQQAAWKAGPLRIQPVLYLTDAGYDSNVYGQIDHPVKDFWLQAGPGINVYLPIRKKIVFSVSESPRYVYFLETKGERAWNNFLQAEVSLLFNRVFVSGGGFYNNYKFRYPFEIDIWPRAREKGAFGSLLFQAGRRTSLSLDARQTGYEFENLENEFAVLKARMNRTEKYLTATGYFQATPRVMFSLAGEFGRIEFDDQRLSFGDSGSRAVYAGIDFSPTGKVRGRVGIGYKKLSPRAAERAGFEGVVGDSSVRVSVSRSLTVRGHFGRDVHYSIWYDNEFFVNNHYGAGVSLYVARRKIRLDFDSSFDRDAYGAGRKIDRTTQAVGAFFRLGKKMGLGLRGGTYDWVYNVFPKGGRRTFVGLNLTYDF